MRQILIPAKFIPEHIVTRCEDCPDFENRGGSYGEYDACNGDHGWYDSDIHRNGVGIPDNCPRLKEKS